MGTFAEALLQRSDEQILQNCTYHATVVVVADKPLMQKDVSDKTDQDTAEKNHRNVVCVLQDQRLIGSLTVNGAAPAVPAVSLTSAAAFPLWRRRPLLLQLLRLMLDVMA